MKTYLLTVLLAAIPSEIAIACGVVGAAIVAIAAALITVAVVRNRKPEKPAAAEQPAEEPVKAEEPAEEPAAEPAKEEEPAEEVAAEEPKEEEAPAEEVAEEAVEEAAEAEEAAEEAPAEEAAAEAAEPAEEPAEAVEEAPAEEEAAEAAEPAEEPEEAVEEVPVEEPEEAIEEAPVEEPEEAVEEAPVEEPEEEIPAEEPVEEAAEPIEEPAAAEETSAEEAAEEPAAAVEEPEEVEETSAEEAKEEPAEEAAEPAEEAKEEPVAAEEIKEEPKKKPFIIAARDADDEDDEGTGRRSLDRSYTARLIQADDVAKDYHAELKAEILSYSGVKSRVSWKHEAFRRGRNPLVRMVFRGKTLCLYFALDPADYAESKYKVEDAAEVQSFLDVPCLYRIKNDRRVKYAKDLIAAVMAKYGIERGEEQAKEPIPRYETTEALRARGLIRGDEGGFAFERRSEVRAGEVDSILADEVAASYVEQGARYADKTKTGIINVDTLQQYFEDGETVTLEKIKKRISGYGKVTYIKVLARGVLSKALTVEADEYSIEAVKMILLVGGKVIRTLRRD